NLPLIGEGSDQFVLMYKPHVLEHPLTREKALEINLFELPTLNYELRKCFMDDYQGKAWRWHRLFWKLPTPVFNSLEALAVMCIAFFNSPRNAYRMMCHQFSAFKAHQKNKSVSFN